MRYITEQELRDTFAQGAPEHYETPADARLTPAARQYLMDLRLYGHGLKASATVSEAKPEDMTHLNAHELVRKDNPCIVLRGRLDSLEAAILCVQTTALRNGSDAFLSEKLEEALLLVRRILASDFKRASLGGWTLDGLDAAAVREASHNPKRFLPEGHVLPHASQGEMAALLNWLRTVTREAEVQAVSAYVEGTAQQMEIILALNRLSSYFYILQLQAVAMQRGGSYGAKAD